MVNVEKLVEALDTNGVKFFTGVPDSLKVCHSLVTSRC